MTRTEYYRDIRTGLTLYAQEMGDRSADTVAGSSVAGDGTLYQFAALEDDTVYEIFEQAGPSPAGSDEALAVIGVLGAKESTLGTPAGASIADDISDVPEEVSQKITQDIEEEERGWDDALIIMGVATAGVVERHNGLLDRVSDTIGTPAGASLSEDIAALNNLSSTDVENALSSIIVYNNLDGIAKTLDNMTNGSPRAL